MILGAAEFSWLSPGSWLAILKVVIGLGTVIFVHELGHFLVAKWCGVKCEKFYLGFDAFSIRVGDFVIIPSKLISFQWGETEYGIGIVPLGGYVKMLGQDDNPANAAKERERSRLVEEQENAQADQDESNPHDESTHQAVGDETVELDPRSYQAKSVLQRMMIISAGVVMNLITAVLFAAAAFGMGAPYQPCVLGNVLPGGPAWVEDFQPGDEVVQIGSDGERRSHLRFSKDLVSAIAYNGDKRDLTLTLYEPDQDGEREVTLRPRTDLIELRVAKLPQIGISPTNELVLGEQPSFEGQSAEEAGFEAGDRIIKMRFEIDGETKVFEDLEFHVLKRLFAQYPDKPVEMIVERGEDKQEVTLSLPPNPARTIGLEMEMGPVEAVQRFSPAEQAGLQPGDRIQTVDGEEVGDPMRLEELMRIAAMATREVEIVVKRDEASSGGGTKTFRILPRMPRTRYSFDTSTPIAVDELGISFKVSNTLKAVAEEGPLADSDLQPGDVLTAVEFVPANDERKQTEIEMGFAHELKNLEDVPDSWPTVYSSIQQRLPDTKVKLTFDRDGTEVVVEAQPMIMEGEYLRSRGFLLTALEKTHQAESVGEAFYLGFRETKENALLVYDFLKKLATREMPLINLGGPGTIAVAATQEAMFGTSRLLLFLTLISANLAVVNFLPIPVLDGGHMMFLTWEAIFRKPMSEKVMVTLSMLGLGLILSLMVFVIGLDFFRLIPS